MSRTPPRVALWSLVIGATALLALACSKTPTEAMVVRSPFCPQLFGSFSTDAHRWPPACWRPYGENSPFNTPIPRHPRLASDSGAIIRYMVAGHWSFSSNGGRFAVYSTGSRPVYWSQPSDPLITVHCRGTNSCASGMRVHIPPAALPADGSDAHMTVVDQAKGREYDFWRASTPRNGSVWISGGNSIPIGPDRGSGLHGWASASYLGLLGGVIRVPELRAGRIDHALALAVPCVQYYDVWPSPRKGRGDAMCSTRGAGPHLGSLLQLNMSNAQISATHAPTWQQAIMRAMHNYGIYVVDTDGSAGRALGWLSLATENDKTFASLAGTGPLSRFVRAAGGGTVAQGTRISMSRFRVIAPCVHRGTC